MGRKTLKVEPAHIQGTCITEGCSNVQCLREKGRYRPYFKSCHRTRLKMTVPGREYRQFKGQECESCGFIAAHPCQLDVDHIDGNKANNDRSNLQTLCANCHRLKTHLYRDWLKS